MKASEKFDMNRNIFQNYDLILSECSIVERIRRNKNLLVDEQLMHAPLIYSDYGSNILQEMYCSYIEIAQQKNLPFIMYTPTWRTSKERVTYSSYKHINTDAVVFMNKIKQSRKTKGNDIFVGGMIGCKNDSYKPEQALSTEQSIKYHSWQIEQLCDENVDFLIAQTLPEINEALGIALAMEKHNVPYLISFVIGRSGKLLDNTSLYDAFEMIDKETTVKPQGYLINCSAPCFLNPESQPKEIFNRLVGYQANGSSLDHESLDESEELIVDDIGSWGDEMIMLHEKYGLRIIGGCCGTDTRHLQYLVDNIQ